MKNSNKKQINKGCTENFDTEYLLHMSKEDRLQALGKDVKDEQENQHIDNNSVEGVLFWTFIIFFILFLLEDIHSKNSIVDNTINEVMFIIFIIFFSAICVIFLINKDSTK